MKIKKMEDIITKNKDWRGSWLLEQMENVCAAIRKVFESGERKFNNSRGSQINHFNGTLFLG